MTQQEQIDESIHIILQFGNTDGAHHKQWVLDQVLRTLLQDSYKPTIDKYEDNSDYEWDTGIAP